MWNSRFIRSTRAHAGLNRNCGGELQSENATPMNALSEEMQAYMQYIYLYLSSSNKAIVQRDAIDTSSDMYQAWKNGTISLREYLYYGIANN